MTARIQATSEETLDNYTRIKYLKQVCDTSSNTMIQQDMKEESTI